MHLPPAAPCLLMVLSLSLGGRAVAAPDLTSTAAFDAACAAAASQHPTTAREQQAYVICNDVAMLVHAVAFVKTGIKQMERDRPSMEVITLAVQTELTYMREQLRKSRGVLEKIRIATAGDGLLIAPATWVRDLDEDGTISIGERYFFAIPVRKEAELKVATPSEDEKYYATEYNLNATIRLDQTDVYWALSYHYYMEALVEIMLSYQYQPAADTPRDRKIRLAHPENMRRAQELLTAGVRTSEKMRLSALRETDDDQEWLANPRQASSSFPVPLDDTDFRIWGELMGHLIPLFEGSTVLPAADKLGDEFGSLAAQCPAGRGLSLVDFLRSPPKYPLEFVPRPNLRSYCRKFDATHKPSGIFDFLATHADKLDEGPPVMRFVRRLLWVN